MPKQKQLIKNVKIEVSSESGSESESESDLDDQKKITQSSQKKRGRPKKTVVQTKQKPSQKMEKPIKEEEEEEEELILHIPIYDNEDGSSDKNMFTMKDDSDVSNSKKNNSLKLIESLTESEENLDDADIKDLLNEIKKKDAIIKKLKLQIADPKNNPINYDTTPVCSKDAKNTLVNLKLININENNKLIVVDKTNVACWWCCHNFDTMPCFIPDRYMDEKFYVFGCFCTYSCAMAYNSNMGDYRVSLRNSLIKELHGRIFTSTDQILLAPAKELLQKFGGPMTIEEFRNKELLAKKEHKIHLPPMVPLLPAIEEIYRDPSQNPKNMYKKGSLKK